MPTPLPTPRVSQWRPVGAIDLRAIGSEPGECQRCGRENLRFLHIVANPAKERMQVGAECARRLCYGYSPKREEARLRNLWTRRSRWLTRNWGTSRAGNPTLKFDHNGETIWVTVYSDSRFGGWKYSLVGDEEKYFSPIRYASADAAKLAAFDRIAEALEW